MKWLILIIASLISLPSNSSSLSQTQLHSINAGHNFSYSQEFVDSVKRTVFYPSHSNINLQMPELKQPASAIAWTLFYTLQILDVYTTDRALQYSCIQEVNPLLGDRPSIQDMVVLKVLLFGPTFWYSKKNSIITDADLLGPNYLMTVVIANNADVWSKAKSTNGCFKL